MWDAKLMEAYYRFMAELARVSGEGEGNFQQLTGSTPFEWWSQMLGSTPLSNPLLTQMQNSMKAQMTPAVDPLQQLQENSQTTFNQSLELFKNWNDHLSTLAGDVVPRARYQELETRYQAVLKELKDSEARSRELQALVDSLKKTPEAREEIEKSLASWQGTLQEMVSAQAQWWQVWTAQKEEESVTPESSEDAQG